MCSARPFDQFLTYGQVLKQASDLAARLPKGCKVGICMLNRARFYIADLACVLAECTSVAISLTHHSLDLLKDCDVILDDKSDFATVVAATASQHEEFAEIYTVFFSSGSTGFPKGVKISREAFLKGYNRGKARVFHFQIVLDMAIPSSLSVLVQASYLPSAWGADRLSVYQTFFNGKILCVCVCLVF
jgi:long-subunit acyl-CoA synthetase (AMP-forming)